MRESFEPMRMPTEPERARGAGTMWTFVDRHLDAVANVSDDKVGTWSTRCLERGLHVLDLLFDGAMPLVVLAVPFFTWFVRLVSIGAASVWYGGNEQSLDQPWRPAQRAALPEPLTEMRLHDALPSASPVHVLPEHDPLADPVTVMSS